MLFVLLMPIVAAAGFLVSGPFGAACLLLATATVPGLAVAEWLLPSASALTRIVLGLALGPLVASLCAIAPFAAGVAPHTIVLGLAIAGPLLWLAAALRQPPGPSQTPAAGLDAPFSRAALLWALVAGVIIVIPPLAHEWARVKGDGWTHAGIVYQILERGVPPEDPRWAGQIMNYVWFYNFFIALLTGVRHSDPFTFMVLLNVCDLFAFLGLAYLTAWAVWRDGRIATWAVVLTAFGLNAGAWLLWPLRAIRGITGSVRGTQAVLDALAVDVTSWRVLYALNAPFSHMVSFLDKFMIGTAINYAWIQMDLAIWAVLAWVAGGPRALLVLATLGAAGMLLFHGVVGLSVIPVLGLALLLVLAVGRIRPGLPPPVRVFTAGVALLVGALAAGPYTRAISQGWDAARTGLPRSYIVASPMMIWTVATSCALVFALALSPARRLVREKGGVGTLLVVFTVLMTGFAVLVNLPEDNESKFAFEVFFPAAVLAAAAFEPWLGRLRARLGTAGAGLVLAALMAFPAGLTLYGLTVDRTQFTAREVHMPPAERTFYAWLARATPPNAVVVDNRFRDQIMVLSRRQLYCGSPLGPSLAGIPAEEVGRRHAVMADLYGPLAQLDDDARDLARLGRPVFVVYRDADFPVPADARALDRAPDRFRPFRDAEGFVVYSLVPQSAPGVSR